MNKYVKFLYTKEVFVPVILIGTGAFLRFYNLNWGSPFYFHPDERNIVSLVLKSSLSDPESLLKGTFAYGNFPVILTLLLKPLFQPFFQLLNVVDTFAQTVVILRTISASFSILTLVIIYLCARFWSQKVALIALFLATFSTGFIQQAHFGTFDGFVAFASITIFYFLLKYLKTKRVLFFYLSLLLVAIGTAAKINLLVLSIFPFTALGVNNLKKKINWAYIIGHFIVGLIILMSLTALLSPNYLTPEFRNSLIYERGLVTGITPVFYTQSFYETTPIVFQFLNIMPFLINPLLTIIFIPSFLYVVYRAVKIKNVPYLILTAFFLILFLPQAFLHAKWTRYMVPTLPFAYLIIAVTLSSSSEALAKSRSNNSAMKQFSNFFSSRSFGLAQGGQARTILISAILVTSAIFSLSYFITTFVQPDTRVAASVFAKNNISQNSSALTEPFDLGIIPFNNSFPGIPSADFYYLDSESAAIEELKTKTEHAEYIILPSQRLLRSRLLNPKKFPNGHGFYSLLTNEAMGYQKIYETPCDIFCKITYLGDPVFRFEETAAVFDRPTVMIFKKIK